MKRIYPFSILLILSVSAPKAVLADELKLFRNTVLTQLSDDIPKAELARSVEFGGYELANGDYQSFADWYERKNFSFYAEGVTLLHENLRLDWGFSTYEHGEKYTIEPMMKLGLTYSWRVAPDFEILLSGYQYFGGAFWEKTCSADYGVLGVVEDVNCRLAATQLSPQDTLNYLLRDNSRDWGFHVQVNLYF